MKKTRIKKIMEAIKMMNYQRKMKLKMKKKII